MINEAHSTYNIHIPYVVVATQRRTGGLGGRFRAIRWALVRTSLVSTTVPLGMAVAVTAAATLTRTAKTVDNFIMKEKGQVEEGELNI